VLDLTLKGSPPSTSSGDLRAIYKRGFSRSCDDLSRIIEGPTNVPTKQQMGTLERIQMYRQGSYTSTTNTPTETINLQSYPFPQPNQGRPWTPPLTSGGHSPSSVFPRSGTVPTISVSTPPQGIDLPQQHVRSRSTNLLGALGAGPAAHRKASFEKDARPHPFIDSGIKHSSSMQDIGVRAEVEFEAEDQGENKRSSQIVHMQGFINRLPSFSAQPLRNPHQLDGSSPTGVPLPPVNSPHPLPKGWKPFKLVLKGSKLYFYKPPHSTISNGIKELFPTQLADIIEEAIEPSPRDAGGMIQVEKISTPRRRRAYWGRGTHPELTVQNGKAVKGSPDALIHEMVFATTFGGKCRDLPSVRRFEKVLSRLGREMA
jgi:GTPase-activating protein BEM2